MSEVNMKINENTYDCDIYISASNDVVGEIIIYTIVSAEEGDIWLGAYYGSIGGGENDGGFFRIDVENSNAECLDYDAVDELEEANPFHFTILNTLMGKIWALVDDQDGEADLYITDSGLNLYAPDESGIWMTSMFDGDSLDQISDEWALGLNFES